MLSLLKIRSLRLGAKTLFYTVSLNKIPHSRFVILPGANTRTANREWGSRLSSAVASGEGGLSLTSLTLPPLSLSHSPTLSLSPSPTTADDKQQIFIPTFARVVYSPPFNKDFTRSFAAEFKIG